MTQKPIELHLLSAEKSETTKYTLRGGNEVPLHNPAKEATQLRWYPILSNNLPIHRQYVVLERLRS